jgi:hypothetical protein
MVLVAGSSLEGLLCVGLCVIVWLLEAAVVGREVLVLVGGLERWEAFGSPGRSICGQRHYGETMEVFVIVRLSQRIRVPRVCCAEDRRVVVS